MKFLPICNDGPYYSHNFLDEAEQLDPSDLTAIAGLMEPCLLKGKGNWFDLVIARANQLLLQFPQGRWTPWFHYAAARGHAAKLAYSDPADIADDGPHRLTADAQRGERLAAIDHFRSFVIAAPDAPESVFAWQEAWRLLGGLPPTAPGFGCGCECCE
jgi:hypothetical protein